MQFAIFLIGIHSTIGMQAVATWDFGAIALDRCISILKSGSSAVDAVEAGIRAVELDTRGQYFVGVGGLPNSDGIMQLDAGKC
jgi:isoaspartyl peptidase/L-asparaginase-like protein (Ntn-hydrolase superfamily)